MNPMQAALDYAATAGLETYDIADRAAWLDRRKSDVTASVVGTLVTRHDYVTPFELYCMKHPDTRDTAHDPEETPAMRRGRILEVSHIALLQEERPDWTIERGTHYFRDPVGRSGATPDVLAYDPTRLGYGVVQLKNVSEYAFRDHWLDPSTKMVEPPLWIVLQAMDEANKTGASWAAVSAMVVSRGLDLYVIDIPIRAGVAARLAREVGEFWRRIEANDPYAPDYARDQGVISRVFGKDDGGEVDLSDNNRAHDLYYEWKALKEIEKRGADAEKKRRELDAEIKVMLGNAAYGRLGYGRFEARETKRAGYFVKDTSYRTVRFKGD